MATNQKLFILESNTTNAFSLGEGGGSTTNLPKGALMRLYGVFATMDKLNRNKHMYNHANYDAVLRKRVYPMVERGCLLGESEHIKERQINYNRVAVKIESIEYNPATKQYVGTILILDTTKGRDVYAIAASGTPIFISSRALGSVNSRTGVVTLTDMITFDVTAEAGFDEAEFHPIDGKRIVTESFVFESLGDEIIASGTEGQNDNPFISDLFSYEQSVDREFAVDTTYISENFNTGNPSQPNEGMEDQKELMKQCILEMASDGQLAEALGTDMVLESLSNKILESNFVTEKLLTFANDNIVPKMHEYIAESLKKVSNKLTDEEREEIVTQSVAKAQTYMNETFVSKVLLDGFTKDEIVPYITESIQNAGGGVSVPDGVVTYQAFDAYIRDVLMPEVCEVVDGRQSINESLLMDDIEGYVQDEVLPAVTSEINSMGTSTINSVNKHIHESLLPTLGNYMQDEIIPEVNNIITESYNTFAGGKGGDFLNRQPTITVKPPKSGEVVTLKSELTSTNGVAFFGLDELSVEHVDESANTITCKDINGEKVTFVTESFMSAWGGGAGDANGGLAQQEPNKIIDIDFVTESNSLMDSARNILSNATTEQELGDQELNYVNESFVKMMPRKFESSWGVMPQASKDILAKQAKQREGHLVTRQQVERFWQSRDLNALMNGAVSGQSRTDNQRNAFRSALMKSMV